LHQNKIRSNGYPIFFHAAVINGAKDILLLENDCPVLYRTNRRAAKYAFGYWIGNGLNFLSVSCSTCRSYGTDWVKKMIFFYPPVVPTEQRCSMNLNFENYFHQL
jgi:hypothetical protein